MINKNRVNNDSHDKCDKLKTCNTLESWEEKIENDNETGDIFINYLDDIQCQNSTFNENRSR